MKTTIEREEMIERHSRKTKVNFKRAWNATIRKERRLKDVAERKKKIKEKKKNKKKTTTGNDK